MACAIAGRKDRMSIGSLKIRAADREVDDEGYETSQSGFWRSVPLHRLPKAADVALSMRENTRSGSLKMRGVEREVADDVQGFSQSGFCSSMSLHVMRFSSVLLLLSFAKARSLVMRPVEVADTVLAAKTGIVKILGTDLDACAAEGLSEYSQV